MTNLIISFNSEDLFQFFGKMALPPWQDMDGTMIGDNIDCAPIAQEIENWVQDNMIKSIGLGCFTTAEMLAELSARAEVGGYGRYRTIDSE